MILFIQLVHRANHDAIKKHNTNRHIIEEQLKKYR